MNNDTDISEIDSKLWIEFMEKLIVEEAQWLQILRLALILLIFVVSVVGNLLTCIVIYYDKSMHNVTNYYLFNLAVSDLIMAFAILLQLLEYFHNHFSVGEISCIIQSVLVMILWNNGTLNMTALALERYVAICHPMMLKPTSAWRRVSKIIVIIWVVAIVEALPEIWTVKLVQTKKSSLCFIIPTHFAKVVNGVLAVVTFVIPLGIMMCVYAMIAYQMRVIQKNTSNSRIFNQRNNRSKVNKLIIALTLSFIVCWMPFLFLRILVVAWDPKRLMKVDKWWILSCKICGLNYCFSAVLNPILFSVISTKFRLSLKALWDSKVKRHL